MVATPPGSPDCRRSRPDPLSRRLRHHPPTRHPLRSPVAASGFVNCRPRSQPARRAGHSLETAHSRAANDLDTARHAALAAAQRRAEDNLRAARPALGGAGRQPSQSSPLCWSTRLSKIVKSTRRQSPTQPEPGHRQLSKSPS